MDKNHSKRVLILFTAAILATSAVAAHSQHNQAGPSHNQEIVNGQPSDTIPDTAPGTVPDRAQLDKGLSGVLPPEASPVAKAVLNEIDKGINNLGQRLAQLLGNGQAANNTQK